MRIWLRSLLLVAAFCQPAGSAAQSVGHDLENGVKDILHIWSAPARLRTDDLPPLAGILAGTGAFALLDERLYGWLASHPRSLPGTVLGAFRGETLPGKLGGTAVLAPISLLLYGAGWIFDEPDLRQAGMGCLSSNLATTLPRLTVTRIFGRKRPENARHAFQFRLYFHPVAPWDMRSFPGGHAANILSCATFWSHRFELGLAEPALYAGALAVGWARLLDGAHWPSDTFVGQAYGWSVGRGVADRYLRRRDSNHADRSAGIGVAIRIPL